jgi:hypothetical protein
MKDIYKKELGYEIVNVVFDAESTDESVMFVGEKTTIKLTTYHGQDCCEHVYADFSIFKHVSSEIINKTFRELTIYGVKEMGMLVCLDDQKYFVPCNNRQNGYYSSTLELQVNVDSTKTLVDISELVEAPTE